MYVIKNKSYDILSLNAHIDCVNVVADNITLIIEKISYREKRDVKMPRISVVDDQCDCLNEISVIISNFYFKYGISCKIDTFPKPELLLFEIKESMHYDIYILDIEMPKINGLELAGKIRQIDSEGYIIFITSHLEFMMEGYDYNAYQYIPKGKMKEKLPITLKSLQKRLEIDTEKYYQISTNYRYEKILYKDLFYVYKDQKNAVFVTRNEKISIRETLKNIYKQLEKKEFILIDRGYIVNIVHIMRISQNNIFLRNNERLKISRTYADKVKESIHNCWKEHLYDVYT